jgi:hypothetical protein
LNHLSNITNFTKTGIMTDTSFSNTSFFADTTISNGIEGTVGYKTQYGWGSGSSPQDMYFPNYNSGVSEAAAVNSIANAGNFSFSSSQVNYMDALMNNTMTKTIVLAFNQYHVVSSIGPLGSSYYGSDGGIYFSNSTAGYERNMGNPIEGGSNSFELGPIGVGLSVEVGFPIWLTNRRVAFGYDLGFVADNTALGIGVYFTSKKPINNPLCFSVAPEVFYAHSAKNSQIKNKDLPGSGYEIMGSAGPIGATYGWDTRSTYRIISISGFGKGIDIGYGSWETNTKVFHFEDLFSK